MERRWRSDLGSGEVKETNQIFVFTFVFTFVRVLDSLARLERLLSLGWIWY